MVTYKCVVCKSKKTVFPLPKDKVLYQKWLEFIERYAPAAKLLMSSGVCFEHFDKSISFKKYIAWEDKVRCGQRAKLMLEDNAVPMLPHGIVPPAASARSMSLPSTSQPQAMSSPVKAASKRPHPSTSSESSVDNHTEYDPDQSFGQLEADSQDNDTFEQTMKSYHELEDDQQPWNEEKYIVPWSFLEWALCNCRKCGEKESVDIKKSISGAALTVTVHCLTCDATYTRGTSKQKKSTFILNYLVSCAILFVGGLPTKTLRMFAAIGVCVPSRRTFDTHQTTYLHHAVEKVWQRYQGQLKENIATNPDLELSMAGDARCDSMGHCAKYGCYSLMDVTSRKVLSLQLVQTEGNSNAMELAGLKKCLSEVMVRMNLTISNLVTDRHPQVRKYMRDNYISSICHYFDIWHVAKVLKKVLKTAASNDACTGLLAEWTPAIINHLYWSASSTGKVPNSDNIIEAKWRSILNHVTGKHIHDSPYYPKCQHQRRRSHQKKKKYMKKGSADYELLCEMVEDKRRLKDVRQLSPMGQTSCLEAFHSTINHFAPKMIHFHYRAMKTRLLLAAIHTNSNSSKGTGENPQLTIVYPKYKKAATVRKVTKESSYEYLDELLSAAFEMEQAELEEIPGPMSSLHPKADDPEKLKEAYVTRFNQM